MSEINHIKIVSLIGAGSWGTSIAKVIAEQNSSIAVKIWAFEKSVASDINTIHENRQYLHGVILPVNCTATNNLKESLEKTDAVILATPSKIVYEISQKIKKYIRSGVPFGYLSKGFCRIDNDIYTISRTIEKAIPDLKGKVVAISGPSHAEEVSNRFHTCLNLGGTYIPSRKVFNHLLSNDYLQCRERDDIIAVDLGGTLKNPAAIAAGMISVLPQCGDNLAGALIAEAMKEMIRMAGIFHADVDTMIDISGLGDLVATSLSEHSRNRRFGKDIALQIQKKTNTLNYIDRLKLRFRSEKVIEMMSEKFQYLAEGAYAIKPLIELAEKKNVSIPVYRSLYEVLLNKKDPSLLIETIKNPERFDEYYFRTRIQISERKVGLEKMKGDVFKDLIIINTMKHFIEGGGNNNKELYERGMVRNSLRRVILDSEAGQYTFSVKSEIQIIKKLERENYQETIKSLIAIYSSMIVDRFNPFIKWMFKQLLRIFTVENFIMRKSGEINISGNISTLKKIKSSENIIYIAPCLNNFDFLYIIASILKKRLPYPRFLVNSSAIQSRWKRFIITRAGGFIVDFSRFNNPVYRETVRQYLFTMIENGMPVLYFHSMSGVPDAGPSIGPFFSIISESIYKFTVEIVVIPVELSYMRKPAPSAGVQFSLRKLLRNRVSVNFSVPIYLSEYTTQPHLIISLPEVIEKRLLEDRVILPHIIICRLLAENNYHIMYDTLKKMVADFIKEKELRVDFSPAKIVKKGVKFLTDNQIGAVKDGILFTDNHDEVEYLSSTIT